MAGNDLASGPPTTLPSTCSPPPRRSPPPLLHLSTHPTFSAKPSSSPRRCSQPRRLFVVRFHAAHLLGNVLRQSQPLANVERYIDMQTLHHHDPHHEPSVKSRSSHPTVSVYHIDIGLRTFYTHTRRTSPRPFRLEPLLSDSKAFRDILQCVPASMLSKASKHE
jgi:hypothetical protein